MIFLIEIRLFKRERRNIDRENNSLGKWPWSFDKVIRGAMIILARKRLRSTLCFLENRGKIAPRKLLGIMERIMVCFDCIS